MDLKALPPIIVNRIARRQPKAIHRIRKILERQNLGKLLPSLSKVQRENSPWSEDSLSSIDRQEVVQANEDYYREQQEQPYSDDLTIEAFTGNFKKYNKVDRTVSLNFNPHSEKGAVGGKGASTNGTSAEGQSPTLPVKQKRGGFFRGSLKKGKGSLKDKKKSQSNTEPPKEHNSKENYQRVNSTPVFGIGTHDNSSYHGNEMIMHALTGNVSALASTGTGLLWQLPPSASPGVTNSSHFVELPIDSNPHISETTGLAVDDCERFYTPHDSEDDLSGKEEHKDEMEDGRNKQAQATNYHYSQKNGGTATTDVIAKSPAKEDLVKENYIQAPGYDGVADAGKAPAGASENDLQRHQLLKGNGNSDSKHGVNGRENSDFVGSENGVAEVCGGYGGRAGEDNDESPLAVPLLRQFEGYHISSPQSNRTPNEKLLSV